jgi:hypothetical protein
MLPYMLRRFPVLQHIVLQPQLLRAGQPSM